MFFSYRVRLTLSVGDRYFQRTFFVRARTSPEAERKALAEAVLTFGDTYDHFEVSTTERE